MATSAVLTIDVDEEVKQAMKARDRVIERLITFRDYVLKIATSHDESKNFMISCYKYDQKMVIMFSDREFQHMVMYRDYILNITDCFMACHNHEIKMTIAECDNDIKRWMDLRDYVLNITDDKTKKTIPNVIVVVNKNSVSLCYDDIKHFIVPLNNNIHSSIQHNEYLDAFDEYEIRLAVGHYIGDDEKMTLMSWRERRQKFIDEIRRGMHSRLFIMLSSEDPYELWRNKAIAAAVRAFLRDYTLFKGPEKEIYCCTELKDPEKHDQPAAKAKTLVETSCDIELIKNICSIKRIAGTNVVRIKQNRVQRSKFKIELKNEHIQPNDALLVNDVFVKEFDFSGPNVTVSIIIPYRYHNPNYYGRDRSLVPQTLFKILGQILLTNQA